MIDDAFMTEVGLGDMPEAEKQAFMEHAREELEVRVGRTVSERLTDEQLEEFSALPDGVEVRNWLNLNVPDYREVVKQIFQNFKQELLSESQAILG